MVRFSCACGKRLKVDAAHAGRAVQCPSCGTRLTVPHPQEAAAGASEALAQAAQKQNRSAAAPAPRAVQGVDALTEALKTSATKRHSGTPSGLPTGRPPAGHHSRKPFIIGLGAAVVVLILLVALSAFLGGRGSKPADEPANAKTTTTSPSSTQRAAPKAGGAGELFKNVPFQEPKD